MAAQVKEGGVAILSGILHAQADEVIDVYARSGFNLIYREEIVDWTSLTLVRAAAN